MTKQENKGIIYLAIIVLGAFFIKNQSVKPEAQSLIENIPFLSGASVLEQQVIFWIIIAVISVIILQTIFSKK